MISSVYPKNGRKIHELNRHKYYRFKSPLQKIIESLNSVKLIPGKIQYYFRTSLEGAHVNERYLVHRSERAKLFNKISVYNSRMTEINQMMNLLHRTWSSNPKEQIQEFIRIISFLKSGVNSCIRFFNVGIDQIDFYPHLRDEIRNLVGSTQRFLNSIENILRSKGVA